MNASTDGGLIGHDPGDKSPRPCNRKEPAIIASELLTLNAPSGTSEISNETTSPAMSPWPARC